MTQLFVSEDNEGVHANDSPEEPTGASMTGALGLRVRQLQNAFQHDWGQNAAQFGISVTPMQSVILQLIADNPGISQVGLADLLSIEAPTVSQALAPLSEEGLIERRVADFDGRTRALYLTPAGISVRKKVVRFLEQRDARLRARITNDELSTLLGLVTKLTDTLEETKARNAGKLS